MPWTVEDVGEHIQGLTQEEKKKWVKLANKVLEQCIDQGGDESTCDARAIRVANANYNQITLEAGNMPEKLAKQLAKKDLSQWKANADQQGIRTDTLEGRPHLVIPVVALKEAVVKGQFLPGQEIRNSRNLWTDVPVPIGHPKNRSARELQIIDNRVVGRFYNVRVEDNKLKGEIWIDEEKAMNKGQQNNARAKEVFETYKRLKSGEPMDVSTSYWHDTVKTRGNYKGTEYNGKQTNLKPDHLAILPDEYGELSLPDGVGVPLKNQRGDDNVKKENQKDVRSAARTPTYRGTATGSWSRQSLSEFAAQRDWDVDTVADMDDRQRRIAAESSLLGRADAEEWGLLTFFQVVDGNGTLYKNALTGVRGGRGQGADIPQSAYESAAAKAKTLLQDEFDVEYSENSLSLIGKVFNLIRGERNMEKQKLVNEILEKAGTEDLSEGDLLDTKQEILEAMAANLESGGGDEPEEDEEEETETDQPEEDQTDNTGDKDIMEIAKNAARTVMEEEKKENLVNKLANSKRVDFSQDELKEMPLSALRKVEQNAIGGDDYTGAAGSLNQNQGGAIEVELVETSGYFGREEGD